MKNIKSEKSKKSAMLLNQELVEGLDRQIQLELEASYFYLNLATYFAQSRVALPGFRKYFAKESEEERSHAQQLIDYQIMRGGKVNFRDLSIRRPDQLATPSDAVRYSLVLEQQVTSNIYRLVDLASQHCDHHLEDFLINFGSHQMEAIHELKTMITQLERVGEGEGLYDYDKHLERKM